MAANVSALIIAASQANGIDPGLALAIGTQESRLNPNIGNGAAGEVGVMQVLPSSAPGVNLYDLQTNINAGVGILASLVNYFGDETSAIAAYNCGRQCVINAQSQGGSDWLSYIPSSTQVYVQQVLGRLQSGTATINVSSLFSSTPAAAGIPSAAVSAADTSLWTQIAVVAFIILGVSLLISES
jgi:soluble lytic murein transglycosylase-like protein